MATRDAMLIGPFAGGLNTFDDPTAINDQECAEALNFDPGLDGSLKNRPPFTDLGTPLTLGTSGNPTLLGYYYDASGEAHLIASDGATSTWAYSSGAWVLITDTFAATDMTQFDNKAWLVSPVGEVDPGGYWTPDDGFTADSDMPRGVSIASYKSRLWVAEGLRSANPTRIRYSKVLGQPDFWDNSGFLDVGSGDGQGVVKILTYFDTMLVFRTKSIWNFQYGSDPGQAIQGVIVPGVGLQNTQALVAFESYLYFMYDEKAYAFINNRAQQINVKVPFETNDRLSTPSPYAVSLFNNRVIFSYYEKMYVYSLRTKTWTTWRSDAWGPIGQLTMPYVDDDTDIAYALPSTADTAVTARNYWHDPEPSSVAVKNGVFRWCDALAGTVTLTDGWARVSTQISNTELKMRSSSYAAGAVILAPGEYTLSLEIQKTSALPYPDLTLLEYEDGSTSVGVTVVPATHVSGDRYSYTFTVDGATNRVAFELRTPPITATAFFRVRHTMLNEGPASLPYFTGDSGDGYEWTGAANESESVQITPRRATLLKIEDKLTRDSEPMVCVLQTKNYNFDVPGSFKVLFWWGVDAIFKTGVRGQVVPGVYNLSTTWGQLRENGVSWGALLGGTWRHPFMSDPSVVSEVVTSPGPSRKFVKFFKKLRFRQIFFRVSFEIDGSEQTSPVQIFTLSTYMGEKQTVSKTVS